MPLPSDRDTWILENNKESEFNVIEIYTERLLFLAHSAGEVVTEICAAAEHMVALGALVLVHAHVQHQALSFGPYAGTLIALERQSAFARVKTERLT